MSKKIGLKVFGATIGIAAAGGIVGFAATNWDGIQKVAQGPVYTEQELAEQVKDSQAQGSESGYQQGYEEGLEEGLSQGYTEEDLQEAEDRGYQNGLEDGVNSTIPPIADLSDLGLVNCTSKTLSNGDILINSETEGKEGLYLISNKDKRVEKLYNEGNWTYYKELSNGNYLISGSSASPGLLFFNVAEREITKISDEFNTWTRVIELSNETVLVGSYYGDGIYLFDSRNKSFVKIYDDNFSFETKYSFVLQNGDCLIASTTSNIPGYYLYNKENQSLTKVFDTGTNGYFYEYNDGILIISSNILYYNFIDRDISLISEYSSVKVATLAEKSYLFSCTNSSSFSGVFKFNEQEKQLEELTIDGVSISAYNLVNQLNFSNGNVLLTSSKGLFVYDKTSQTLSLIEGTKSFKYFYLLENGDVLMSSDSSSTSGLYILSLADKTVTQVYSTGYRYQYFNKLSNGNVIVNTSTSGHLLLFDIMTKEITCLYDKDCMWTDVTELSTGDCVILSTAPQTSLTKGLIFYDSSANSVIHISSGKFTRSENNDGTFKWVGENGQTYEYDFQSEQLSLKSIV